MGIARSTYYDVPDAGADDATVVAQMKTICDEFETGKQSCACRQC